MGQDTLRGFNTQLQEVDDRYSWINDMIKARQDLVLMYMKLLNLTILMEKFLPCVFTAKRKFSIKKRHGEPGLSVCA